MSALIARNKTVRILFALSFLFLTHFTLGQAEKEAAGDGAKKNQIVIKEFHFTPQTLTVKAGEKKPGLTGTKNRTRW
jgi:plastocyanin